jgi:hypothetical protein
MDNVFIVSLITLAVVAVLFLLLPFVYNKFNNVISLRFLNLLIIY